MQPLHGFDYSFISPSRMMQYHPQWLRVSPLFTYVLVTRELNRGVQIPGTWIYWTVLKGLGFSQPIMNNATLITVNVHFDFWLGYCTSIPCFTLYTLHVLSGLKLIYTFDSNNRFYVQARRRVPGHFEAQWLTLMRIYCTKQRFLLCLSFVIFTVERGCHWQLRGCHKVDISYHVGPGPWAYCLRWLFLLNSAAVSDSHLPCHAPTMPFFSRPQHSTTDESWYL